MMGIGYQHNSSYAQLLMLISAYFGELSPSQYNCLSHIVPRFSSSALLVLTNIMELHQSHWSLSYF